MISDVPRLGSDRPTPMKINFEDLKRGLDLDPDIGIRSHVWCTIEGPFNFIPWGGRLVPCAHICLLGRSISYCQVH